MRRVRLTILCACGVAASTYGGDLLIHCESGLEIFVDGESVGTCDEAESINRVTDLEAGDHTIRVEGEGGASTIYALPLGWASTQAVIPELVPSAESDHLESTKGEISPPLGSIEITSNPRQCEIEFEGRKIQKRHPIVLFLGIPVGEHDIVFRSPELELSQKLTVQAAQTVRAMADFGNQRVAVTSPELDRDKVEPTSGEQASEEEPECIEYWIQVMRTNDFEAIEPMQSLLRDLGFPKERQKIITVEEEGAPPIYKLRVGPIERANTATWAAGQIRNAGIPSVWVLPKECGPSYKPPKRKFKPVTSGG